MFDRSNIGTVVGLVGVLLSAPGAVADAVSTPTRLFGLGSVEQIAITPDLRVLATGGQGGAYLWDVETAALRVRLDTDWRVTALAFSPDGHALVSASRTTLTGWDTATGKRLYDLAGHRGDIARLQFTPDGRFLISASADNTVRLWSLETGTQVHSIRIPGSPVVDAALSPDGLRLATVDTFLTNGVKVWDIGTEALLYELPQTNSPARRCLFTSAGELLTLTFDRTLTLWGMEGTTAPIREYSGVTGSATVVMDLWMPNDAVLGAVCNDGRVFLWNLGTGQLLRVVAGEPVIAALGVPNEHLILSAHADHDVRLRQLPEGDALRVFEGHTTSTYSEVAYGPDGRTVLGGGTEAATRLWDRGSGGRVREFVGSPAGTAAAAFSPDGSKILTTRGFPDRAALLWDAGTAELEREFKWVGDWPTSAVFTHDGTRIAVRAQGEGVRIYDVATGTLLRTVPDAAYAAAMAFSPDDGLLCLASGDSSADLIRFETGQLLRTFTVNAGPVISIGFSPAGDALLIAWEDGYIRIYDTVTLEVRLEFATRAAFLEAACFSPDGRFILTGEGWPLFAAGLWDARTARLLRSFEGHQWSVSAVAFSPDGLSVLTGADLIREWSVADIACRPEIERLSDGIRLTWSGGELQEAASPEGPWLTRTNAVSPLTLGATGLVHFFRVRLASPE